MADEIRYLQRQQVETDRWDKCMATAANGRIYGCSFYLDAMAGDWDGLVLNDYDAVMPLPWRKKWGIYYLYQPFLTAQLGVFGNHITSQLLVSFLQAVPKKFSYWDFSLNAENRFEVAAFPLFLRTNFVLSLQNSYAELYQQYRENTRRNLKKSLGYGNRVTTDVSLQTVLSLTQFQTNEINKKEFAAFASLFSQLQSAGQAKIYGVAAKSGDIVASAVFLFSGNRAYYILVGNHPNGRTLGASHALIDAFIQDHAGQNLVLDFEGSDIRNLAFFYSSFGAKEEPYAAIRLNRLPFWAKWLKN